MNSRQQLKQILAEDDPHLRSILTLDRLLDHARELGNRFWLLATTKLSRGYPVWVGGENGTFLPHDGDVIPDGAFTGTVTDSARQSLLLLEAWSPGIELNYHPSSWMEGLLAAELRTAR